MTFPYMIGVWQPSLEDCAKFVSDRYLGDNVIQIIPDTASKQGGWIMLRVTGDQERAIRHEKTVPRPTVIP